MRTVILALTGMMALGAVAEAQDEGRRGGRNRGGGEEGRRGGGGWGNWGGGGGSSSAAMELTDDAVFILNGQALSRLNRMTMTIEATASLDEAVEKAKAENPAKAEVDPNAPLPE